MICAGSRLLGWPLVRSPRLVLSYPEDLSDVSPTVPGTAQPLDFEADQAVESSTLADKVVELARIDGDREPCPRVGELDS